MSDSAGNKTCIGQAGASQSVSGNNKQVLIGRGVSTYGSPAALVVNSDGLDSSVVVYGNLIVRGQTYMYGKSPFPSSSKKFEPPKGDALMGYTFYKEYAGNGNHKPFYGLDGSAPTAFLTGTGDKKSYQHQVYGGKEHCICTYSGSVYGKGYSNPGIESYDWSKSYNLPNRFDNFDGKFGYYYSEDSGSPSVELSQSHAIFEYVGDLSSSCCPVLTESGLKEGTVSDLRLKNVGNRFALGLDSLSKLNIYNYTFKSDSSKTPQVGVIAQDLKLIFPNAVTKGSNSYYKIRWDEIFYSAINSVKELNNKIVSLNTRLVNNLQRISKLKKENKKLEDKILKLANEIEKLEQNK
jgi:hypothetical protein